MLFRSRSNGASRSPGPPWLNIGSITITITISSPEPLTAVSADSATADGATAVDGVFCCRALRLDQVALVGFDLDYTLAVYHQPAMDAVTIAAILRRLPGLGYPDEVMELPCPSGFATRGLLVDIDRGNVLKMDRHRYVKAAYHGTTRLSRPARRDLYEARRPQPGDGGFRWVDTLYSLPDIAVYVALVDFLDERYENSGDVEPVDYAQVYRDVRSCADAAHHNGEIYAAILAAPDRFLRSDDRLANALHRLRSSGKRLFLLTNSTLPSAEALLSYLLDGATAQYPGWRQFFDVVIVEAAKPSFFVEGSPFSDMAQTNTKPTGDVDAFRRGHTYRGGNRADFERLIGESGDRILYVGDHVYGDVLRPNRSGGWRTVMVLQELADEHAADEACAEALRELAQCDAELLRLHDELRELRTQPTRGRNVERLSERIRRLEAVRDRREDEIDTRYHPYWGSLFKAGAELSIFGAQVEQYAWLYCDRVGTLAGYSPMHYFRPPRARMPHER